MSERRNPFLGFEQIRGAAPNTKVGAAKIVERFESEASFASFCKLAHRPLVRGGQSVFLRALGLKLWRTLNSQWSEVVIWGFVQLEQSIALDVSK